MTIFLIVALLSLFMMNFPIFLAISVSSILSILIFTHFPIIIITQRMVNAVDSFPLMAVPLFMLAGALMDVGGISKRIVGFAESLVGWLPGGLAAVSVVASMFFAGISGSAAADTAAVGALLIPSMIKMGYKDSFSAAIQSAGGSIGVIIPPSIPMIIYGFITGTSISKLFAAGILPGLLMGLSLIFVAIIISKKHGYGSETPFSIKNIITHFKKAVWSLGAPVIILGGILGGIFTATEAAAVAVVYGFFVGKFVYKELNIFETPKLLLDSGIMSSVILFIISTASIFGWLITMANIPQSIAETLSSLTKNPVILILIINMILLIAGTFVETTVSLILLVPIFFPMLPQLGIDPVQMGVIIVTNLAIGMLTPPLGICLIVSCGISKNSIVQVSRAIVPFLLILIIDLLIITFYPPLTMFLPSLMK